MRRVSCVLLAALSFASPAQTAAPFAVPKGPIKVTSQRADIDEQGRLMLYRGKVRLTSGQLELKGERLELRQPAAGQFEARVTGEPARLSQAAQGGSPPLAASAELIVYDTREATLKLNGDATLSRGNDVLTGDRISYDLATRRISAAGTDGEQIKFVIQPPSPPSEEPAGQTETAPAPAQGPAP